MKYRFTKIAVKGNLAMWRWNDWLFITHKSGTGEAARDFYERVMNGRSYYGKSNGLKPFGESYEMVAHISERAAADEFMEAMA